MTCTSDDIEVSADALALIHEGHRAAVLAHPDWHAVAREREPALQLVWMVKQRLLSYDELYDLLTFDEEASDSDRIVEEAFGELGREYALGNCRLLDQLRADGLITPAQQAAAMAEPIDAPHDGAADLLFSLVLEGVVSPDAFYALHADVLAEQDPVSHPRRRETLRAAYGLLKKHEAWRDALDLDGSRLKKAGRAARLRIPEHRRGRLVARQALAHLGSSTAP